MSISKVFFQFFFSVFYFSFVSFFAFCPYSAYNEHDGMTETTRLNWIRWEWNIVSMPMDLAYFPWSLSFYGFTLTSSDWVCVLWYFFLSAFVSGGVDFLCSCYSLAFVLYVDILCELYQPERQFFFSLSSPYFAVLSFCSVSCNR